MKKILIIAGTNSSLDTSINWRLSLRAAAKIHHHTVNITNLSEHELPIYRLGMEKEGLQPEPVIQFARHVREHDALIIVSPEHNGLMPACLKNAIDWLSRTRKDSESFFGVSTTPILLLSTSPGANGGATNLKYMAELMPWWGGDVIGTYSVGSFYEKYRENRFDDKTESDLEKLIAKLEARLR